MRAQITGLDKAQDNAKDGISLVQTAEGALTEVHDMLNRMYELAEQSANGTYEDGTDRVQLQKEVTQLKNEINRIADSANFNGINLLDGSMAGGASISGKIGTTNVSFSIGSKSQQVDGANDAKVTLSGDGNTDSGKIDVTITDKGAITIKLGTKGAAASYTADEITQAVRDAAKALAEKNGATDAKKKVGNGLASFTMKADGKINLAASGTDSTGDLTFAAGTGKGGLPLQIGDTSASYNKLDVTINDCHTGALGIADLDIGNQTDAADALKTIKDAINYVSDVRGTLGATQNRLDHTINNLSVMQENIQDAESTIRDTDVADEMMAYTKNNILIQSAQAMLAQANQVPQGVLQLLQ